ncbi:MAG: hypothetical protein LBE86_14480 [Gemmobacter sp.]|jgi:hypothetical protein|nr:hypothetical protein [Gemmobacter sp.]
MSSDLYLVSGIVLSTLSISSFFRVLDIGQKPRMSIIFMLTAVALIALGWVTKPGGYGLWDIPNAFYRLVGEIIHLR